MQNIQNITSLVLLTLLAMFTVPVLLSMGAHADEVVDDVSVTVPVSCSMSGSGAGSHSATIESGIYRTDIGITTLKAFCNDNDGFSIYAIGFSNDTLGTNTLIGANTSSTISSGTATSGDTSNWAMKLTPATSPTPTYPMTITSDTEGPFSSYHTVPTEHTKVATRLNGTDVGTNAEGSTITTTYSAFVTTTQSADTYNGKVKYTLVHPNTEPAPEPPKTYLQDATLADCGKTMYDKRDSSTETAYTTALIGDVCWMTTNLNLAGGTALSANDTDVASSYISSFITSNNLIKDGDTIVLPASTIGSGFNAVNYSYVANSGNTSTDCGSGPGCYSYYSWDAATLGSGRTIATNTDAPYSICPKGWHLPNTREDTDDASDFRKLMIALGGTATTEFYYFSSNPTGVTMSSALQASPNNFLLAGGYGYGSLYSGGILGSYWSSTSDETVTDDAQVMNFYSDTVHSANNFNRRNGFPVRCVLGS